MLKEHKLNPCLIKKKKKTLDDLKTLIYLNEIPCCTCKLLLIYKHLWLKWYYAYIQYINPHTDAVRSIQ